MVDGDSKEDLLVQALVRDGQCLDLGIVQNSGGAAVASVVLEESIARDLGE